MKSSQPELVLIRGLPGSGKSTLAKKLAGFKHIETDQFFSRSGLYRFEKSALADAHAWCKAEARAGLDNGENVVVSNTFVTERELKPYLEMGFPFRVYEAPGEWKNIHGVPSEAIEKMRAKWEPCAHVRPLSEIYNTDSGLPVAPEKPSSEQAERNVFDLIMAGHPEADVYEYIQASNLGPPRDVVFSAVSRFVRQADAPTDAHCGFLLDSFRTLAKEAANMGDFGAARANLKEYFSVVRYMDAKKPTRQTDPHEK